MKIRCVAPVSASLRRVWQFTGSCEEGLLLQHWDFLRGLDKIGGHLGSKGCLSESKASGSKTWLVSDGNEIISSPCEGLKSLAPLQT